MLSARVTKTLELMRMAITIIAGCTLMTIYVPELISPKAGGESYMPWWQFGLILIPILTIFAIFMYQQSKAPTDQNATDRPVASSGSAGYRLSPDMRRLLRMSYIASLVGVCLVIPMLAWKLTQDVGTKSWVSTLCIGCIVLMSIPDFVRRVKAHHKQA